MINKKTITYHGLTALLGEFRQKLYIHVIFLGIILLDKDSNRIRIDIRRGIKPDILAFKHMYLHGNGIQPLRYHLIRMFSIDRKFQYGTNLLSAVILIPLI